MAAAALDAWLGELSAAWERRDGDGVAGLLRTPPGRATAAAGELGAQQPGGGAWAAAAAARRCREPLDGVASAAALAMAAEHRGDAVEAYQPTVTALTCVAHAGASELRTWAQAHACRKSVCARAPRCTRGATREHGRTRPPCVCYSGGSAAGARRPLAHVREHVR